MFFYADFHIHSKFSRATSPKCDLENLSIWGQKKGLTVVGTGDFTHPGWMREIKDRLVPAEPGLFKIRKALDHKLSKEVPKSCRGDMRFFLSVEISSIYKRHGKTRKVHNLVFAPDLEKAGRIIKRLSRIGNLHSDGRPILGLDSHDLLEIVLEAGEGCFLIPAHVWTPWFSVFGSKSGFDSLEECFGDLTEHIFALETGLSSDPPMNWRVSALDRYSLVSNSDAHSPPKLGREACLFDTDLSYFGMMNSLKTGKGFDGTLEFFPEEGKYHLDGHRKCNICLKPPQTRKKKGLCPKCGKNLTVGVLSRVEDLADRPTGKKGASAKPFRSLIPLPEILSEISGRGPATKTVAALYEKLLEDFGPEFYILEQIPLEKLAEKGHDILARGLGRMRQSQVIRQAGYDGEFGKIRLFKPLELKT